MAAPTLSATFPASATAGVPFDVLVGARSTNPDVPVDFTASGTSTATNEVGSFNVTVPLADGVKDVTITSSHPGVVFEQGPGGPLDFTVTIPA